MKVVPYRMHALWSKVKQNWPLIQAGEGKECTQCLCMRRVEPACIAQLITKLENDPSIK
jgi:hypothetical protein